MSKKYEAPILEEEIVEIEDVIAASSGDNTRWGKEVGITSVFGGGQK